MIKKILVLLIVAGYCVICHARIYNLTVLTDNIPDYTSLDRLAHSLTDNWSTDDRKTIAIWRWTAFSRHEASTTYENGQIVIDPIKVCASYTCNHCEYTSRMSAGIAERLGYSVKLYDMPCHHTIGEIWYGSRGHMIDADFGFYFLRKNDRTLAGFKEIHDAWNAGGGDVPTNPVWLPQSTNFYSTTTTYSLPEANGRQAYALYFENSNRSIYEEIKCIGSISNTRHTSVCDTGAHFLLNLKPGEVYTRYPDQLGSTADYYVPRAGGNPNANGKHLNGNGKWEFRPDFGSDIYKQCIESESNIERSAGSPLIHPANTGSAASLVFRVDGANVITSGSIIGKIVKGASDAVTISVSTNGTSYQQVWSGSGSGTLAPSVKLSPAQVGQKYTYWVKVEMTAASSKTGVGLDSLNITTLTMTNARFIPFLKPGTNRCLFDMGAQSAGANFMPVEITYAWTEHRETGNVDRSHTEVVADSARHEYYINVMGPKTPTMKWVRINFQGYGPSAAPGYSDGQDIGFDYERPLYFIDYGWDLAYKKPYTSNPAADVRAEPGTFLTNGRTPFIPSTGVPSPVFSGGWSTGKNPVITVDLGSAQSLAGARILQIANQANTRYADSVQVLTSTDNQNFTHQATVYEIDVWNPPTNYLWPSRFDMFANKSKQYYGIGMFHFPALFADKVNAQYVQFRVFNAIANVYICKLQVLDEMPHKLVMDEFAHGFAIKAEPNISVEYKPRETQPLFTGMNLVVANPFTRSARIMYSISSGLAEESCLEIFNVNGRLLKRIPIKSASGQVLWHGRDDVHQKAGPGLYLVRLRSGQSSLTRRMIRLY